MASNIIELFGYAPRDSSTPARAARANSWCAFRNGPCVKRLRDGTLSGVCALKPKTSGPVICCPIRLYSSQHKVLRDVATQAFGSELELVVADQTASYRHGNPGKGVVAVFGKGWGKELRLPNRAKSGKMKTGAYFVDWILAKVEADGQLSSFVAVEVQSIDTTGNYQAERSAYLDGHPFAGSTTAGLNWENVNKRILPQIIYKGHVLRREPLCAKGLFFICPTPVYRKIAERLGDQMSAIHQQPGSVTMLWYDLGPETRDGEIRDLVPVGRFTTTVDQVALAFTAPSNLPPPAVYEQAIRAGLQRDSQ